jgi:hypothetical protein
MGMKMITKIDRMIIEMIYKLHLYGLIQVLVVLVIQVVKVLMEVR